MGDVKMSDHHESMERLRAFYEAKLAEVGAEAHRAQRELEAFQGQTRYECKDCGGTKLEVEAKDALLRRAVDVVKALLDQPPYNNHGELEGAVRARVKAAEDARVWLRDAQEASE